MAARKIDKAWYWDLFIIYRGKMIEREIRISECRSCKADIVWLKTQSGKNIPVNVEDIVDNGAEIFDPDTMTSHFATCPDADKWRKK